MNTPDAALVLDGVCVDIDNTRILTDVSMRAEAGSWVGVIGPNGAGKSTMLNAICGIAAFRGSITVAGAPLAACKRRDRATRVALVPQTPQVPPGATVFDYVLLGRTPYRAPLAAPSRHDLAITERVAEQLDLAPLMGRLLATLSGGERQRAFLARALAQQTRVVLLDEPTAALDIGHQLAVLDLVDEMRRELGLTVVTTLHDLLLAGRYPDTLVMLANGRVVAHGPPESVLTEAIIEEHYGTAVRVMHDGDDIVVIPRRRNEGA